MNRVSGIVVRKYAVQRRSGGLRYVDEDQQIAGFRAAFECLFDAHARRLTILARTGMHPNVNRVTKYFVIAIEASHRPF